MPSDTILALSYLIAELTASGLNIRDILREAQETGNIPQEHWDRLTRDFDDAQTFWNGDTDGQD